MQPIGSGVVLSPPESPNYKRRVVSLHSLIASERTTYLVHVSSEIDFQEMQLQHLIHDLEAGHLTENLLPRQTLNDILWQYKTTYRDGAGLPLTYGIINMLKLNCYYLKGDSTCIVQGCQ
jgi:hypothetical protein